MHELNHLRSKVRQLEDTLFDICFQRNAAESRYEMAKRRFDSYKRAGLIDNECTLEEPSNEQI